VYTICFGLSVCQLAFGCCILLNLGTTAYCCASLKSLAEKVFSNELSCSEQLSGAYP